MNTIGHWPDIDEILRKEESKPALLLGNGFSINLYEKFNYTSLYEEAKELEKLFKQDQNLFEALKTQNFEYILRLIKHAELYLKNCDSPEAKKISIDTLKQYDRIRQSLVETIKDVHCSRTSEDSDVFKKISEELIKYNSIFTTNYDLLIYWSIMKYNSEIKCIFKDYFWNNDESFSLGNTELWEDRDIPVYYLHGSIFIYHDINSYDYKRKRTDEHDLLSILHSSQTTEESPLIVAEGDSHQKHISISNSDYLEFCFNNFKNLDGNLVILGHSLNKNHDEHILSILSQLIKTKKIAISIYNPKRDPQIDEKEIARHSQDLNITEKEKEHLYFFHSNDHPLCNPDLGLDIPIT
jgi:hypothetical protein